MRTVQRYLNLADACLAKTLLDDYEISCALFDENAHLYIGTYFAVPVRLVVAQQQFRRAERILAYVQSLLVPEDPSEPAEIQQVIVSLDEKLFGEDELEEAEAPQGSNNPWEILAIAYLLFVPGLGFLLEHRSLKLLVWRRWWDVNRFLVLTPFEVHLLGTGLICVALGLVVFYVYARREMAQRQPMVQDSP